MTELRITATDASTVITGATNVHRFDAPTSREIAASCSSRASAASVSSTASRSWWRTAAWARIGPSSTPALTRCLCTQVAMFCSLRANT